MGLPALFYLPVRQLNRNIVIGGSVVLFHIAALWALQSGLVRRAVEIVVPVAILSDIVTPPIPKADPVPQPLPPQPPEPVKPAPRKVERARPAPRPLAIPDPAPAPRAPVGVEAPAPLAPAIAAPVAPPAPAPAPAPRLELPSSDADYLRNPPPVYPPLSKRLGEQGKVLVRVLIGPDGAPQNAQLKRSSGFDRLDRAALDYVMNCRYAPGKVGGVPQAMWHEAPVNFVLE